MAGLCVGAVQIYNISTTYVRLHLRILTPHCYPPVIRLAFDFFFKKNAKMGD